VKCSPVASLILIAKYKAGTHSHSMWKQKIRNAVLDTVEKTFALLSKPFSEAEDLEAYCRRGFYLLGILIVAITSLLWWQGILTTPLSQSNILVRSIYTAVIEKTVILSRLPDSYVTLAFLPFIVYMAVFFWPKGRRSLGELTANSFFWILNRLIGFGELCIEHRWFAFFLIICLSAGIAALTTIQAERLIAERRVRTEFEYWLEDADQFITYNPVTTPEPVAYNKVHSAWRSDFSRILTEPDGTTHPAICLNEILDELYLEQSDRAWIDTLQLKVSDLTKTLKKCNGRPRSRLDLPEARTSALMNLLMARINVRLAEDVDVQSYSNYQELVRALEFLKVVSDLEYGSEESGHRYRADAFNGQGTVYGNALTAYLNSSNLKADQIENLRSVCTSPAQCAMKALIAYQNAGQGWARCSYQGKRELNNSTDLLIRIGQHYNEIAKSLTAKPLDDWAKTRSSLASQISQHIQDLMSCNSAEPFLSTFVLTAAQGFAVSAQLKRASNEDGTADMIAAGRYLRLSNSLEPQNVSKWEYSYFCFAVEKGTLNPTFRDAIALGSDGLPSADRVVDMIVKKCQ
jgi:hypothetical protein